uniref:Uncharacterized protein n=1 Tax=uncultured bacterium A1Q1_fos_2111 TaxID=1256563 RepID=L7W248_9BACT|nr:hypothetical protein [uncultured bacterium A1Q1_fos_2111]
MLAPVGNEVYHILKMSSNTSPKIYFLLTSLGVHSHTSHKFITAKPGNAIANHYNFMPPFLVI